MADVVVSEAAADDIIMRIVVVGVVGSKGADFSLLSGVRKNLLSNM